MVTQPALSEAVCGYSWMYMVDSFAYGVAGAEASVLLNSDYLPESLMTELSGVADIDKPITVDITYENTYYPVSKITSYGDDEILAITLDYDDTSGFLTDIDVYGDATYTSMQCRLDYYSNHIPRSITLGIANVDSMKFEYIYPDVCRRLN